MSQGPGPPSGSGNDPGYDTLGLMGGVALAFWFALDLYQMFVEKVISAGTENYGYQYRGIFDKAWFGIAHLMVLFASKIGISTGARWLVMSFASRSR